MEPVIIFIDQRAKNRLFFTNFKTTLRNIRRQSLLEMEMKDNYRQQWVLKRSPNWTKEQSQRYLLPLNDLLLKTNEEMKEGGKGKTKAALLKWLPLIDRGMISRFQNKAIALQTMRASNKKVQGINNTHLIRNNKFSRKKPQESQTMVMKGQSTREYGVPLFSRLRSRISRSYDTI